MKLSTREDIEAPIESVFAAASDFAGIERQLRRRGIAIERVGTGPVACTGMTWQSEASWRGRPYRIDAELVSIDADQGYAVESRSSGVVCLTVVDLIALSKTRTRMLVSVDIRPTTLSSRLLVQSLKLAKGRLGERFRMRVAEFARRIEG